MYNVFNDEQTAREAQRIDYQAFIAKACPRCREVATAWAAVRQRATDARWVYLVCPDGYQGHRQEELNTGGEWFPK